MPVVQIEMMTGRTVQQKREMVQRVTEALVETVGCSKEAVTVIIREMEKENYAHAGELVAGK